MLRNMHGWHLKTVFPAANEIFMHLVLLELVFITFVVVVSFLKSKDLFAFELEINGKMSVLYEVRSC
jgi:hypothetical protein